MPVARSIIVMNEIGLDPGIDHLYAVKTIYEVHKQGGKIMPFLSYCGGLASSGELRQSGWLLVFLVFQRSFACTQKPG